MINTFFGFVLGIVTTYFLFYKIFSRLLIKKISCFENPLIKELEKISIENKVEIAKINNVLNTK